MTQLPTIRTACQADLSILSEYWYDRMALRAYRQPSARLSPQSRLEWEHEAAAWLNNEAVRALVSVQNGEVIGGLFVRLGPYEADGLASSDAAVLALVIDLHTVYQRQGVGRILVQALRTRLHDEGIVCLYAPIQTGDMLETTFWPRLGAQLSNQWFKLNI